MPPESRKSFSAEDNTGKPQDSEQPKWLQSELHSLNSLKAKFSRKYKRTFKKIEACQREEQALQMTNAMYLDLMQKVLKMAGVERGQALLERLAEKRESSSAGGEQEEENQIDEKIKESIHSVRESLKALEDQLEQGQYVQT